MRYEGRRVLHCIVLYYIMIIIYKMYLIFNFKKSKGVNLNKKRIFIAIIVMLISLSLGSFIKVNGHSAYNNLLED